MHLYLLASAWALAAYVVFKVISNVITNRRHTAEAKRLGCKPIQSLPNSLPFALDRVYEAIKADRGKVFPNVIQDRWDLMGGRTYDYYLMGNRGFFTAEPKNIQAILATQFNDYCLGSLRRNNFFPLLGNGIFTEDGKAWEHSRSMMRPQFSREQVSDLDLEEHHVQNMMRAIPVQTNGWTSSIDLQPLFFRLTLDSATEFLFGESVDSQITELATSNSPLLSDDGNNKDNDFALAFDVSQKYLSSRARLGEKYWINDTKDFRQKNKVVHDFVDYFVKLALNKDLKEKELEKGSARDKDRYVFLDAMVAVTRDPIELRSQLLNILLAGRDTTASLLGWLFFALARQPHLYQKLRASILEDFGTYSSPSEISFTKLKNCQYLQFCMNEALRLYPVVPLNSRRAAKDTTLPLGGGPDGLSKVYVKKGEQVDYSVHVVHRRKDLWGQDAEEYNPERWAGRKPGWEYLPFNGGPRICIGQQFALTEASYVAVRLMQRFDQIENRDTDPVLTWNLTLTSSPGTGCKVQLHEASE